MRSLWLLLALASVSACTYGVIGTLSSTEDAVGTPSGGDNAGANLAEAGPNGDADGGRTLDASQALDASPALDAATSEPDAGCSRGGSSDVTVSFVNKSPAATYDKLWVDYQCGLRSYGRIAPGQSQSIGSYGGHVWSFRDTSTGVIVKSVRLGQSSPATINIP